MIKLFKAIPYANGVCRVPSPTVTMCRYGVRGENLGDKTYQEREITKAAGERRSRRRPYFCAYTNSAKEMSVFVGQMFYVEHFFLNIPLQCRTNFAIISASQKKQ